MGVVYRARDTRLGRDVAVKVLAEGFAGKGEFVRRFEVEARAAGVLNHPNIVAIHDIGIWRNGPYLVSELLEGETLREAQAKDSPFPVRKVIDFGLQIAHGLAAAHEKGIVHRDLKPENLFLTRDGQLKILDFGLARLIEPVGGPAHSESTIRSLKLGNATLPGTVMGTVGYMAPEQARGQPADHRADIFAAGSILYELLADHPAFQGGSGADVLSAIVSQEAPALPAEVPPGLERVIRHCLAKNPEERFQSAGDLAFELETVKETIASAPAPRVAPPRPRIRPLPVAGALLAALALSIAAWMAGRRAAGLGQPAVEPITFRRGTVSAARFGPEGIAYAAAWQGGPRQIFADRRPEPKMLLVGDLLSVSPKGELLVLQNRHDLEGEPAGTLLRVSPAAAGDAPRQLLEDVEAADWAPDGESLAVVRRAGGRSRLEYPPGRILYETDGAIGDPRVSRDGKEVACVDRSRRGSSSGAIALVDAEGGARNLLTAQWAAARGLAWSPSGKEVWFTAAE